MSRLTLRLLGAPEVLWAGRSLRFRSRKELALLVYLVGEGGRHHREKLIALFWPESDRARGGAALRNTLARLRRSLEVAGEFVVGDGALVSFAFDRPVDLDLHTVETAATHLSSADLESMQAALALARGEFLEGFSLPDAPDFDAWMAVQREWWHHRVDTLFAELARRQLQAGMSTQAVQTALRWTRHAALNEAAYRALMEAYVLAGERTAALQVYESCEALLARELGVAPAPETRALAERIRQDDRLQRSVHAGRSAPPSVSRPPQSVAELPLVGRAAEHARLADAYRRVCQGLVQSVCLAGEAGMGKTRLADAFLDWVALADPPADVLRGRAFEVGGRLPYQPVVDALRARVDRENAPDDLLADVWLAELSQLLPELRERYPDLPSPMAGDADFVRGRLFEAVALLGIALATRRPLVLFVDDVQWADAGTRDLLHYLARRWAGAGIPAMLLLTVRQEGVLTSPDLRDWLAGLGRDVALTRLELAPLTRADLRQLVRAVDATGDEPGMAHDELGDWLLAETAGSPFFLSEMLQMLQEQGLLAGESPTGGGFAIHVAATLRRIQSAGRLPVPPNVRGVILARLARLSNQASALLLAGAVIGRECSFTHLCQVARLDEFDALPALEELLNSRLMLDTGDEARPFTFAHDNIRDVAYTEAGVTRRRLYHRQALAALERDHAPSAELAFHAAAARLYEPAFRYAIAAGDAAMALHAYADAVAHYGSALELVDRVEHTSAERCHLCTQHGRALELSERYPAALAHYEEMARLGERTGDRALALAALVGQGTIRVTPNELSDRAMGEALGQQALALARELGDRAAEAKIHWYLLNVYRLARRRAEAISVGERSLALAQELDLREQMAYTANDLVYAYAMAGDISHSLAMAQTATALWRELGNQPMLTDSLSSYAHTLAMTGAYEAALEIAAEGLQIGRAIENQWAQAANLISHGLVYWRRMEVDRALAVMDESIRLGQAAGFVGAQTFMRFAQAQVRLALGDTEGARALAQAALELATRYVPLLSAAGAGTLALVAQQEGNLEEAAEMLATIADDSAHDTYFLQLTPERARCRQVLLEGDYERADRLSGEVLAFLEARDLRMFIPDFLSLRGQALTALGEFDRARRALKSAVDVLQATGGRWYLWEIAALLADLADARGHPAAAGRWQATARATIQAIAAEIADPALRALFLNQPSVSRLLAVAT